MEKRNKNEYNFLKKDIEKGLIRRNENKKVRKKIKINLKFVLRRKQISKNKERN